MQSSAHASSIISGTAEQHEDSKLSHALALASAGLRVFPLVEGGKLPLIVGYPDKATTDPERIRSWWTCSVMGTEQDYNIGIATGRGLVVLDEDNKPAASEGKPDKTGAETLAAHIAANEPLPATLTAETPTGGRHYYFATDADIRNSAEKLGGGLDTRGHGGYVVAPGSTVPAGKYKWRTGPETRLAALPGWLGALCSVKPERVEKAPLADVTLDTPAAHARSIFYLENDAPPAVEGAGGDDTTYRVACQVRDFGVSRDMALQLLMEHWNERCSPPWPIDELERKVDNAYRYAQNAPGSASAAADFGPVDAIGPDGHPIDLLRAAPLWRSLADAEPYADALAEIRRSDPARWDKLLETVEMFDAVPVADLAAIADAAKGPRLATEKRPRLHLEWFGDIEHAQRARPLVKGLLDRGAMSVVYGPSNVGKTFVVLDLALHVAMGWPWRGRKVEQCCVLYVAAEGGGSVRQRVAALRAHHEIAGQRVAFALVPCPIDLHKDASDTKALVRLVSKAEAEMQMPVGLVVIDTLARAMSGGNENAPEGMGAFVRHCDELRTETGAHVLIVHHSGRDEAKGARGHSSLRAAVDTEIEITPGVAKVTKQRDYEGGATFPFRLAPVDLGTDVDGEPVSSCVIEVPGSAEADFGQAPLPEPIGKAGELLARLRAMSDNHATGVTDADSVFGAGPWLPVDEVRAAMLAAWTSGGGKKESAWTAFRRATDRLTTTKHAECDGERIRLTRQTRHVARH
jgi:hypothetical protein